MIIIGKGPAESFDRAVSRGGKAKGRRQPAAKLCTRDVRRIRKIFVPRDREFGAAALGREYRVSVNTILGVAKRKMWRHVT